MNELEQVSTLIGDIYDAALDPALWGSVLEQTCQFVDGCNAGLLAHDLVQDKGHLHLQWGTDPRYVKLYEKVYAKVNRCAATPCPQPGADRPLRTRCLHSRP